jgi:hypothetical protein
MTLFSIFA